jgi:hypothetical protein
MENRKRFISLQVWDFDRSDNRFYDFTPYILEEDLISKQVMKHTMRSRYYAITSEKLLELMHDAGFENIH